MKYSKKFTFYVYCDDGVSEISLQSVCSSFKKHFPNEHIEVINSKDIIEYKLTLGNALIMPGGADLPYCQKLNGLGNQNIQQFIADGGLYIGICAGAYYATSHINFTGDGYRICEDRELKLFSGNAIGSLPKLTNGDYYDETTNTKSLTHISFTNGQTDKFYYHGGPCFHHAKTDNIIAHYETGEVAVVWGNYGKGAYLLSGVHFELCPVIYNHYLKYTLTNQHGQNHHKKEKKILQHLQQSHYGEVLFNEIKKIITVINPKFLNVQ